MNKFPVSYTRKRLIDLEARRAARKDGLPSRLSKCGDLLADAADAEVTYFNQILVLRAKPKPQTGSENGEKTPDYVCLPGWYIAQKSAAVREAVMDRSRILSSELKIRFRGVTPDPSPEVTGGDATTPSSGGVIVPGDYREVEWIRGAGRRIATAYVKGARSNVRVGATVLRSFGPFSGFPLDPLDLSGLIKSVIDSVAEYQRIAASFSAAKAVWAVGVEFEQVWESEGYRRGRLVRSIPLTPGEQLEIQVKSWDRQTMKKNLVESIENNLSTELTGEEKWTLAAKMGFVNQTNASVNPSAGAHAGVTIPIKEIPVEGGGNLGLSGNLSDAITHSMDSSNEYIQSAVLKAANSLKSVRTSTVETIHEVGTETATKQVIANTNRCHSVTYHFFEVVEDFKVVTRPVDAQLYLLIPLPLPQITLEWVLCHECLLRRVLTCADYYAGFEAAKRLRMQEIMAPALASVDRGSGLPRGHGREGSREYNSGLSAPVQAVLDGYHMLRNAILVPPLPAAGDSGDIVQEIGKKAGEIADAIGKFGEEVGKKVEEGGAAVGALVEETGEKIQEGLEVIGGKLEEGAATAGGFFGMARSAPNPSAMMAAPMYAFSPGGPSGGAGSFIYWRLVEIVAPEISDSLAFLDTAWPATQSVPASQRGIAEFSVLQQFFGKLGDPNVAFGKVDAAVALLAAAAVGAGTTAGGVVGGVVGGVAGAAIGVWGFGVSATYGAVIGGVIGAGVGAVIGGAAVTAIIALVSSLEPLGLADTVPDDEGLKASILALKARFDTLVALGPLAGDQAPTVGGNGEAGTVDERIQRALAELRELAEAQVEYDRLVCHLNENLVFYAQAIWSQWPDYRVAAEAEAQGVPRGVVENHFSGFVGDRGALRVIDLEWVKNEGKVDWEKEIDAVVGNLQGETPPELITLPTQGMVVEPAIGGCSACEDFIDEHRKLDLENRRAEVDANKAKARQQELEAERFEKRLAAGKLEDPTPYERSDVSVEVKPEAQP